MANSNGAVTMSLEEAKILVMQGMKGDPGESPRINPENNHWEVYDNDTEQWVDTGVNARGPKGDPGSGEGGGSSLPEVDSSDVGKVLRVNSDAEWDVLDPPEGVPSVTAADSGKVLMVNGSAQWAPTHLQRQVVFLRHCTVAYADAQVEEHTIQRYVDGAWVSVTGAQIAGLIDDFGMYPIIEDYPSSYPRLYKPEQVLSNIHVVFRTTQQDGTAVMIILPWNSSVATVSNVVADLPDVTAADAGKVLAVNANGYWSAQTPSGGAFTIHLTGNATNGYQITESAADIMAHYPNLVIREGGTYDDEYFLVGAVLDFDGKYGYLQFSNDDLSLTDGTVRRAFVHISIGWDSESPSAYGANAYKSATALRNLPQATSAQNGKLLSVVNGNYALVDDRLPAVTASDNGKVLKVVNGVWTAVAE